MSEFSVAVLQSAPKQVRHAADVKAAEGLPSPAATVLAAATPDPELGSVAGGAARAGAMLQGFNTLHTEKAGAGSGLDMHPVIVRLSH